MNERSIRTDTFRVGGHARLSLLIDDFLYDHDRIAEVHVVQKVLRCGGWEHLSRFARRLFREVFDPMRAAEASAMFVACVVADLALCEEHEAECQKDAFARARGALSDRLEMDEDLSLAISALLNAFNRQDD